MSDGPPPFEFNPLRICSARESLSRVQTMPPDQFLALLLYYSATSHRNTHVLLREVSKMQSSVAQLQVAVVDLTTAFSDMSAAIAAEVTNLRATITPDTDPAIVDSFTKIESIVTSMKQATADAKAAIAPPVSTPAPDPAPTPEPDPDPVADTPSSPTSTSSDDTAASPEPSTVS